MSDAPYLLFLLLIIGIMGYLILAPDPEEKPCPRQPTQSNAPGVMEPERSSAPMILVEQPTEVATPVEGPESLSPQSPPMIRALSSMFSTEKTVKLFELYHSIQPEIPPGIEGLDPQDCSHSPAAVKRLVIEIVGTEGLNRLREAAKPPVTFDAFEYPLTHPLYGWWIHLKE